MKKHESALPTVNAMILAGNITRAAAILERLVETHPEFQLYRSKLEFCRQKLKKNSENFPTVPTESTKGIAYTFAQATQLVKEGKTSIARPALARLYEADNTNLDILSMLAKADLIDDRFSDALHKARVIISLDPEYRDAYRIGEQAAIELGKFHEANIFYLSLPQIVNPPLPRKRGLNPALPPQFVVPPPVGAGNDYEHISAAAQLYGQSKQKPKKLVSVIIPVFNRARILANTLAALTHQTYPRELIEVIVVDDGSDDDVLSVIRKYEKKLKLLYARQEDLGFRVAAARNLGLRQARGEAIVFMDADILPCPTDIQEYMNVMHVSDEAVVIGHRRYVDTSSITDEMILSDITSATGLPSINPNNDVADRRDDNGASIDWRYPIYKATSELKKDLWPFTKGAAGNLCFSRKLVERAGFVDEEFTAWGCEDIEHCYRLYNAGGYFIPLRSIESLHQEPLNQRTKIDDSDGESPSFRALGHAITKPIFSSKCPAPVARQYLPGAKFENPKVSIYIPAYNAGDYIVAAVTSCLQQTFGDLEVCICDDGSTDNTVQLLQENFGTNSRVRWITQENAGIGAATNRAIQMTRGLYIAQLDADDLLKPNAVRQCVQLLDTTDVDGVYSDCDYIDKDGKYIRDGWCGGEFDRSWMATGMIVTHFRMFRKRVWSRTIGCNEKIKNAVDLDLWLKIFERGNVAHIHDVLYSYRWHGQNTSILHRKAQETNHLRVVAHSLSRQGLARFWEVQSTGNRLNPREFVISPSSTEPEVGPKDVIFLIPTCVKYADKTQAVRETWAAELQKFGFRYLFLMGKPELNSPLVEGDVLYVPCPDNYESLLLKLVLGYEFLYKSSSFTHLYKIDDDCYPDLKHITTQIIPQLRGKQYVGGATHPKGAKMNNQWHFGKCSDSGFDRPYKFDAAPFEFAKGGYGYFLRRDVLPLLVSKISDLRQELESKIYSFEDVRISEILGSAKIFAQKLNHYSVALGDKIPEKNYALLYDIKEANLFSALHDRWVALQ